jgi:hypothetical protein
MVSSSPKEGAEKNPTVLEDTAIVKPDSMGLYEGHQTSAPGCWVANIRYIDKMITITVFESHYPCEFTWM